MEAGIRAEPRLLLLVPGSLLTSMPCGSMLIRSLGWAFVPFILAVKQCALCNIIYIPRSSRWVRADDLVRIAPCNVF